MEKCNVDIALKLENHSASLITAIQYFHFAEIANEMKFDTKQQKIIILTIQT